MQSEVTVKSEKIFDGKIINLRVDTVELPNQKYAKREIVEHRGAVGIVALNENNEIALVKQYRKAVEDFLLEIPAGKLEVNESPEECAKRELIEETGFKCKDVTKICEFYTSPGFSNEKIYLYLAKDLEFVGTDFDEDEFIEIEFMDKEKAKEYIKTYKIIDAKTIIGISML